MCGKDILLQLPRLFGQVQAILHARIERQQIGSYVAAQPPYLLEVGGGLAIAETELDKILVELGELPLQRRKLAIVGRLVGCRIEGGGRRGDARAGFCQLQGQRDRGNPLVRHLGQGAVDAAEDQPGDAGGCHRNEGHRAERQQQARADADAQMSGQFHRCIIRPASCMKIVPPRLFNPGGGDDLATIAPSSASAACGTDCPILGLDS
jgi:hypothetical protein